MSAQAAELSTAAEGVAPLGVRRTENLWTQLRPAAQELLHSLRAWPWLETARTLRERFREDRLGLTAGSLTFSTLMTMVPLLTVMLAVFSAFPMFSSFQDALNKYFLTNLVPPAIARPVLDALTGFAARAHQLGSAGLLFLLGTALALMLTIDHTLNAIWRVRRRRPVAQRLLVYWGALTLGPLLLGISLTMTTAALSMSRGWVTALGGTVGWLMQALQFLLLAAAAAGLYAYVPATHVRWRHAWAGGFFVALAFTGAKSALAWYVAKVPVYSSVYGALAALPIFLLWLYLVWVIVLLGAVVAAYAPTLSMGIARRPSTPGHRFDLALGILARLQAARNLPGRGTTLLPLAAALRVDPLLAEQVLEVLVELNWVGRLDDDGDPRHVLLCEPATTRLQPLVERLLLADMPGSKAFREALQVERLSLASALP